MSDAAEDWFPLLRHTLQPVREQSRTKVHPRQASLNQEVMRNRVATDAWTDCLRDIWNGIPREGDYAAIIEKPLFL